VREPASSTSHATEKAALALLAARMTVLTIKRKPLIKDLESDFGPKRIAGSAT